MEMRSVANHLCEDSAAELNLTIAWSVAFDTDIASAIIRIAENGDDAEGAGVFGGCGLVAMATHGRGGMQCRAMGSVTERVLDSTPRPLLIVRPLHAEW